MKPRIRVAFVVFTLVMMFGCVEREARPAAPSPAIIREDRLWLIAHAYQVQLFTEGQWIVVETNLTQAEAIDAARQLRNKERREAAAASMHDPLGSFVAWYRP